MATVINGDFLSSIVARELSPQMAGNYVNRNVEYRSLALTLGQFQADWGPHSDPTQSRFGTILTVDATYHSSTWTGLDGYPEPTLDDGEVSINGGGTVNIGTIIELVTVDGTTNYVSAHPDTYMSEVVSTEIELPP